VAEGYMAAFPLYGYETLCSIGHVVSQQI